MGALLLTCAREVSLADNQMGQREEGFCEGSQNHPKQKDLTALWDFCYLGCLLAK